MEIHEEFPATIHDDFGTWYTIYGGGLDGVLIPPCALPDEIDGLTAEVIGLRVLSCLSRWSDVNAIYQARETAASVVNNGSTYYRRCPEIKLLHELLHTVLQCDDEVCEEAATILRAAIAIVEERDSRKSTTVVTRSMGLRRNISKQYYKLFVQLGRRDGFFCQHCGNPDNLQIDHVVPISKGGDNELTNLQILCAQCNRSKGDGDKPAPVTSVDLSFAGL